MPTKRGLSILAGGRPPPPKAPKPIDSMREWRQRVERARAAVLALAVDRSEMSDDVFAAVAVAKEALDLLAGDRSAAPRVRRMHAALVATTREILYAEVSAAATNANVCKPSLRALLVRRFLARMRPHLAALGVPSSWTFDVDAVADLLARWRLDPRSRRRELTAEGVVVAMLVLCGSSEKAARMRLARLPG